jgi:hypothetical protein
MYPAKRPPKAVNLSLFEKYNQECLGYHEKHEKPLDLTFGQWLDNKLSSGELKEESLEVSVPFYPAAQPLRSYKRVRQQYFRAVSSFRYGPEQTHFGWIEVPAEPIKITGYEGFDLFAIRHNDPHSAFDKEVSELFDGRTGMSWSCFGSSRSELAQDFIENGPGREFMTHLIELQVRDFGPSPRYALALGKNKAV